MNQISAETMSLLYLILGGVLLVLTLVNLMHIAFWLMTGVAGYKLLNTGMRMRGYPSLFMFLTRFFTMF